MHSRGLPFDSKMIEYAINNLVVHPNLVFNGKANNFAWVRLGQIKVKSKLKLKSRDIGLVFINAFHDLKDGREKAKKKARDKKEARKAARDAEEEEEEEVDGEEEEEEEDSGEDGSGESERD